ncbi:MAG: di-trans,poly-cis-decaprenylcistransferase [Clostridia bacterium]|nr:di-trans,poly-cis-decaprenylcistransferase [Clostridia bacterium]
MDGNGRWAKQRGLARSEGHRAGVEAVRRVIRAAAQMGIPALTLYAFSAENWKRPASEVEFLWKLLADTFQHDLPELKTNGVRVRVLGERDGLPPGVVSALRAAEEETAANTGLQAAFAVNYGARQDILRVVRAAVRLAKDGRLKVEDVDEAWVNAQLSTAGLPELDLLIRSGGEMRVSNFLLWELAYAEFWSTPVLWPDFTAEDFYRAIADFQQRERRFGGIPE